MSLSDIGESSGIVLRHCTAERKEMIVFLYHKIQKTFFMRITTLCYIKSAQLIRYSGAAMAFAAIFPLDAHARTARVPVRSRPQIITTKIERIVYVYHTV
jgi:hypothetical protein